MKTRSTAPMRVAKIGYIVMSLFFCAAGAALITRPGLSVSAIGRVLGVSFVLFGAVKLIGYFSRDLYRLAFQYDLGFGLLLLVLGALMLARPSQMLEFLFTVLGVTILTDGLYKVQIAVDAKRFGIPAWWLTLALAVAAGVAGMLLVFRPWESARLLTVLLGVALLAEGVLNLCVAVCSVKIVSNQQPDVIDVASFAVEDDDLL